MDRLGLFNYPSCVYSSGIACKPHIGRAASSDIISPSYVVMQSHKLYLGDSICKRSTTDMDLALLPSSLTVAWLCETCFAP